MGWVGYLPSYGQHFSFHKTGRRINCERCHASVFSQCDKYHYACNSCGTKIKLRDMEDMAHFEVIFYKESVKYFTGWAIFTAFFSLFSFLAPPMLIGFVPLIIVFIVLAVKSGKNRKKAQAFLDGVREAYSIAFPEGHE